MDNRTKGIIATAVTAVLCGCSGLFMCIFGALGAVGAPVTTEWGGVTETAPMDATVAYVLLCVGLIFLIIPVVVGIVTLRKKSAPTATAGPVPPAA